MQLNIGLGVELGQSAKRALTSEEPATPAFAISLVSADGWQARHPDPDMFDPETSAPVIASRQGFDATGGTNRVSDTLKITTRVRKPYPNQSEFAPDSVALSDFVYAGDHVAGASNLSERAYPKPIAMWLNHDREHARGGVHTVRLAVAHAYARLGRPVAAVKFVLSDGQSESVQMVSAMTTLAFSASGLSVPHFAADMDLGGLQAGAMLTVDAVIYPWVGEAFTISTDADAYPSPNLTTLRLLNDRINDYGTAFAYVETETGDDATAVASTDPTLAKTYPFATIVAAVTAIRTFNAVTFGRDADAGGGIVRLGEGIHTCGAIKTPGSAAHVPLILEAADAERRATTILTDGGTSRFNGIPSLLTLRNLTLRKVGGNVVFLDSGASSADSMLVAENCVWDANGTSYYGAWVYRVGRFFQINCAVGAGGDPKHANFFSTEAIMGISIGCKGCAGTMTYQAAGCSELPEFSFRDPVGSRPAMQGVFLGWNIFSNGTTPNPIVNVSSQIGPRGFAFVGNIVESWGTTTNAAIRLNADSNLSATENVVLQHNTIAGERANLLYLDGNGNAVKSAHVRYNIFHRFNIKGDVFATRGENIGNWAARFKVGWAANASLFGANNEEGFGSASWLGEVRSDAEATQVDPVWQDDRSHSGTDQGGGTYIPQVGNNLPVVPLDGAAYPSDLFGNTIIGGQSPVGAVAPAG